jgi:hypothetical protein
MARDLARLRKTRSSFPDFSSSPIASKSECNAKSSEAQTANSHSPGIDPIMSKTKSNKRKRGPRKPQVPKPLRVALKRAKAERERAAAQEDTEEDDVLSSMESDDGGEASHVPEGWQALEDEMNSHQAEIEDEREVSWSPSPEPRLNDAGECLHFHVFEAEC